jgi:omega-6 fatty acid desaturase (delta-12 desaturase)
MGKHYIADVKTPFWTAFFRNQRSCKFVEESEGAEGSGVYFFRNLFNRPGETQPINLIGDEKRVAEVKESKSAMASAMSSSRNLDARRRLSQSAQLRANLPMLADG